MGRIKKTGASVVIPTGLPAKPPLLSGGSLVLEPGKRIRLADQLYGQVFDQITAGLISVGVQLPSEAELSEQFGVSRPVVREALQRLRADGLITSHQGLGTFVTHQPATRTRRFASVQDIPSYMRCQEVRIAIEGDAARLAAERRTPEQMQALDECHSAFAAAMGGGQLLPSADLAFHDCIAQSSGNDLYPEILQSVNEAVMGFMRLNLNLTRTSSKQRGQAVLGEHTAIVEAIRAGNPEEARVAMQFHLSQARRRLIDGRYGD